MTDAILRPQLIIGDALLGGQLGASPGMDGDLSVDISLQFSPYFLAVSPQSEFIVR